MNKKAITFLILELLFLVAAPLITVFSFYTTFVQSQQLTSTRVNLGIIAVALLVWVTVKKLLIDKRIDKLKSYVASQGAVLEYKEAGKERDNLIAVLKRHKTELALYNAIMPLLIAILAVGISYGLYATAKYLESQAAAFAGEMAKYTVCLLVVFAEFVVGSVMGVMGERAGVR